MSKRNFILLITVLIIIAISIFVFFYFQKHPAGTGNEEGGTNFFAKFNPFGKSKDTTSTGEEPADISGYTPEFAGEIPIKLKKVSSMPVAGYGVFQKERYKDVPEATQTNESTTAIAKKPTAPETEFVSALRYGAREDGNIYQTFADKLDERRFTSTVIPKIYEAKFGVGADSVIMRYLRPDEITIETFTGTLPKEILGADQSGENQVKGFFLPQDIKDLSISPDLTKIFYLFEQGDGAIGITSNTGGDSKVQVFNSPFTEWLSEWPTAKMITLTTKPSSTIPGYMYAIDVSKKDFHKILGGINGLTTLTSPDGKSVLYGDGNLSLNVYNVSEKTSRSAGVRTLPEKCVWSKTATIVYCAVPKFPDAGAYPDIWYKGETSFTDEIWAIDVISGSTSMLVDPIQVVGGDYIDGIKLMLDKNERYLFFVNKKDSYLWELDLQ